MSLIIHDPLFWIIIPFYIRINPAEGYQNLIIPSKVIVFCWYFILISLIIHEPLFWIIIPFYIRINPAKGYRNLIIPSKVIVFSWYFTWFYPNLINYSWQVDNHFQILIARPKYTSGPNFSSNGPFLGKIINYA